MSEYLLVILLLLFPQFASCSESESGYIAQYWINDPSTYRYEVFCNWDSNTISRYVENSPTAHLDAAPGSRALGLENFLADEYVVSDDNEFYCVMDGVLYSKDMSVLYLYPPMKRGWYFQIPTTVHTIDDDAFKGSFYLRELVIPDSVVTMAGDDTFYESSVEIIHFPRGIESFNTYMFDFAPCIKELIVPEDSLVKEKLLLMKEYIDFSDEMVLY